MTPNSPTVVICTLDGASTIDPAVRSVLAQADREFQLLIVDQSEDSETRQALGSVLADPRVRYHHEKRNGHAHARNVAFRESRSEWLLFTDDDCRVDGDWVANLADATSEHPGIGVVFGNVLPAPHDPGEGFIISYVRRGRALATSLKHKHRIEGISGCMAVSRAAWTAVGGFDESFGLGSSLRSADDVDFVQRVLGKGIAAYETDSARVTHHGFRAWADGDEIVGGYLLGIGAALGKLVHLHPVGSVFVLTRLACRWALGEPVVDLGHLPSRWLRLKAFLHGFGLGLRRPLVGDGHFRRS